MWIMEGNRVRAWQGSVRIPARLVGRADHNPDFRCGSADRGGAGPAYPIPVIDQSAKGGHGPADWEAVLLDNGLLRIMLLPQLGGRVHLAVEKPSDFHLLYYCSNQITGTDREQSPVLGLCGPWVGGSTGFNPPDRHRLVCSIPLDHRLQENSDGSMTAWISELDRVRQIRSLAGFTLRPNRALLEISVRLYNGSDRPQAFLWCDDPAFGADRQFKSAIATESYGILEPADSRRHNANTPASAGGFRNYACCLVPDAGRHCIHAWLNPGEEKSFTQCLMPCRQIGRIRRACPEGAISLDVKNGQAHLGAHVTSPGGRLRVVLSDAGDRGRVYFDEFMVLVPESPFIARIPVDRKDLAVRVRSEDGQTVLFHRTSRENHLLPLAAPAEAPPAAQLPTSQRGNPARTRMSFPAGTVAPGSLYGVGLSLRMQGQYDEAREAFRRSVSTEADFRTATYLQLAQLAAIGSQHAQAIEYAEQSLASHDHNHRARRLKVSLLRRLGRTQDANAEEAIARSLDPMHGVVREDDPQGCIELGLEYISAGLLDEGVEALMHARDTGYPMLFYLAGWAKASRELLAEASWKSPVLCFPHRPEELLALRYAVDLNPNDGHAWYLLGNVLFSAGDRAEAIDAWEKAARLVPEFATVHRNLALATCAV
jgi:tetratricopeptide (TPR) repeat protein